MATSDEEGSGLKSLLRSKLNADHVKLWLPPYTAENGEQGASPKEIIEKYSQELKISEHEVSNLLEELRLHSLDRLTARNKFNNTGIATLRVKLPSSAGTQKRLAKVDISLKSTGDDLRSLIAEECNLPNSSLKLVVSGKFIVGDQSLESQKITVNSQVMAIVTGSSPGTAFVEQHERLLKTRADAELLAAQSELNDNRLIEIADQTGRPLQMPKEEQRALTIAMLLNEKGVSAVRRKEYPNALLLLLEADQEFKKCSSDILNKVDNYALLCMDITWCYLCLQNIEDLPDAEERLRTCQELMDRSYGQNLERLAAVKGSTAHEAALLMRLHLLQGIVCYYKKQWQKASRLLKLAEDELRGLKVDDSKLAHIMSLGYSPSEARLGLRNSTGDLDGAVNFILRRRTEKLELEDELRKDRDIRKRSERLGRTINGELINANFYDKLVSMGYRGSLTKEALRQSNNNISMAVQIMVDQPHLLNLPDDNGPFSDVTEEMIAQVASFGFDADACRKCLEKFYGDVNKAVDHLLGTGGIWLEEALDSTGTSGLAKIEEDKKALEAYRRLTDDITDDHEAHLDITLAEEETFLLEYKALLWHVL